MPRGGFLFSLHPYRTRFLLVAPCPERRSGAEPSRCRGEHHLRLGPLPASFARCGLLAWLPPPRFPPPRTEA